MRQVSFLCAPWLHHNHRSTTNLPKNQYQHHSTTNFLNHTPTSLIKTPYTDDRPKASSKPIFTDQSIHWKTQFHASIMSCKDWGFVVGVFAWMGFAVVGFWPFLWQRHFGRCWVKTFNTVDTLTEEEVDLKAYRCCRWVKWIKLIWVCNLWFKVGKICRWVFKIWGWNFFLKFVIVVGGFAIWGNSEVGHEIGEQGVILTKSVAMGSCKKTDLNHDGGSIKMGLQIREFC